MRILVLMLALLCLWAKLASGVVPALMDLTLVCDPRPASEQVRAYRFYERSGTNWILLAAPATNRITLTNVLVTIPHTYGVSASNALGESDISQPYVAPNDPKPPTGLGIIQTSLLMTNGGTIAGSTDLATWADKQTVTTQADGQLLVKFKIAPRERVEFWKAYTLPVPPLPGGAP